MSSGVAELEPRPSLASSRQRINIPLPTVTSTHSNASYHDNSNICSPTESPFSFGLKKSRWFFDRVLGRANDPPRSHASFPSHHRTRSLNPNAFLSRIPTKIVSSSSPSTSHRRSVSAASTPEPHVEYTSNNLTKTERAEKVRRNRKVLQILGDGLLKRGTGPTGDIAFDQALNTVTNTQCHSPLSPSAFDENFVIHKRPSQLLVENRRHSSPVTSGFSPDILIDPHLLRRPQFDSQKYIHPVASHQLVSTETEVATPKPKKEERLNDQYEQSASVRSGTPTLAESNPSLHSTDSFTEGGHSAFLGHATLEQLEEKGRARKRATLAKLHRFLGSRVPADLVLGFTQSEVEASLPPMESTPTTAESNSSGMARAKSLKSLGSQRLRRKRSPGGGSVGRRVDMGEQDADDRNPVSYMSDGGLDVRFGMLTDAERNRIVRKRKKITKVCRGFCTFLSRVCVCLCCLPSQMMGDCPLDILTQQSSPFPPKPDKKDLASLSQEAGKSSQYMQHRYSIDSLTYLMQNVGLSTILC